MDQNLEKFEVIRNIEKLYEEVFTRKGMGSFMKFAWNNIKEKFNEDIIDFSRADYTEFKIHIKDDKSFKFSTINRKTAALSIYENFLIKSGIRKEDKKIIVKRDFYKIDRPYITRDMLPNNIIRKVRLKDGKNNIKNYRYLLYQIDILPRIYSKENAIDIANKL